MDHPKQEEDVDLPEWARATERVELAPAALAKIGDLITTPPKPNERLRAAARRHWRK